jgi:ABC-type multidrug transport system ATPase subunit
LIVAGSDSFAARFLSYADKILIVSRGRVLDGGTLDETVSKSLTKSLELEGHSIQQSDIDTEVTSAKETAAQVAKVNQYDDLARATGDLSLYWYYFKAVGVFPCVIFVAFVVMNVFCNSFTRK